MKSVAKLATEIVLENMLIETVRNGIKYAESKRKAASIPENNASHEGMMSAADILASILPGICPAQVGQAFEDVVKAGEIDLYGDISMENVLDVIEIAHSCLAAESQEGCG